MLTLGNIFIGTELHSPSFFPWRIRVFVGSAKGTLLHCMASLFLLKIWFGRFFWFHWLFYQWCFCTAPSSSFNLTRLSLNRAHHQRTITRFNLTVHVFKPFKLYFDFKRSPTKNSIKTSLSSRNVEISSRNIIRISPSNIRNSFNCMTLPNILCCIPFKAQIPSWNPFSSLHTWMWFQPDTSIAGNILHSMPMLTRNLSMHVVRLMTSNISDEKCSDFSSLRSFAILSEERYFPSWKLFRYGRVLIESNRFGDEQSSLDVLFVL